MATTTLPAAFAARLQVPDDGRVRPRAVRRSLTVDLLARRRRLHLTNPYFAASTSGPRADLTARAQELWAIEVELVRRRALPDDGATVLTASARAALDAEVRRQARAV